MTDPLRAPPVALPGNESTVGLTLTKDLAGRVGVTHVGSRVTAVMPGSGAEAGGVRTGMRIVAVGSRPVGDDSAAVASAFASAPRTFPLWVTVGGAAGVSSRTRSPRRDGRPEPPPAPQLAAAAAAGGEELQHQLEALRRDLAVELGGHKKAVALQAATSERRLTALEQLYGQLHSPPPSEQPAAPGAHGAVEQRLERIAAALRNGPPPPRGSSVPLAPGPAYSPSPPPQPQCVHTELNPVAAAQQDAGVAVAEGLTALVAEQGRRLGEVCDALAEQRRRQRDLEEALQAQGRRGGDQSPAEPGGRPPEPSALPQGLFSLQESSAGAAPGSQGDAADQVGALQAALAGLRGEWATSAAEMRRELEALRGEAAAACGAGQGGAPGPAAGGTAVAPPELGELRLRSSVEVLAAERPAAGHGGAGEPLGAHPLHQELAELRSAVGDLERRPDPGELREELAALRSSVDALAAERPAGEPVEALRAELAELRSSVATLGEERAASGAGAEEPQSVAGLREELAELRGMVESATERSGVEPGCVQEIRDELAELRSAVRSAADADGGAADPAAPQGLAEEVAELRRRVDAAGDGALEQAAGAQELREELAGLRAAGDAAGEPEAMREELRAELRRGLREELRSELRDALQGELREELRRDLLRELQSELRTRPAEGPPSAAQPAAQAAAEAGGSEPEHGEAECLGEAEEAGEAAGAAAEGTDADGGSEAAGSGGVPDPAPSRRSPRHEDALARLTREVAELRAEAADASEAAAAQVDQVRQELEELRADPAPPKAAESDGSTLAKVEQLAERVEELAAEAAQHQTKAEAEQVDAAQLRREVLAAQGQVQGQLETLVAAVDGMRSPGGSPTGGDVSGELRRLEAEMGQLREQLEELRSAPGDERGSGGELLARIAAIESCLGSAPPPRPPPPPAPPLSAALPPQQPTPSSRASNAGICPDDAVAITAAAAPERVTDTSAHEVEAAPPAAETLSVAVQEAGAAGGQEPEEAAGLPAAVPPAGGPAPGGGDGRSGELGSRLLRLEQRLAAHSALLRDAAARTTALEAARAQGESEAGPQRAQLRAALELVESLQNDVEALCRRLPAAGGPSSLSGPAPTHTGASAPPGAAGDPDIVAAELHAELAAERRAREAAEAELRAEIDQLRGALPPGHGTGCGAPPPPPRQRADAPAEQGPARPASGRDSGGAWADALRGALRGGDPSASGVLGALRPPASYSPLGRAASQSGSGVGGPSPPPSPAAVPPPLSSSTAPPQHRSGSYCSGGAAVHSPGRDWSSGAAGRLRTPPLPTPGAAQQTPASPTAAGPRTASPPLSAAAGPSPRRPNAAEGLITGRHVAPPRSHGAYPFTS